MQALSVKNQLNGSNENIFRISMKEEKKIDRKCSTQIKWNIIEEKLLLQVKIITQSAMQMILM